MTAEEFINAVSNMGVAKKSTARRYVKENPKEDYSEYSDMRDVSRLQEEIEAYKHHQPGYHNFGRCSGMTQDTLSYTGRKGRYEETLEKVNKEDRQIRQGKRDPETGEWIKKDPVPKESIPEYLLKPWNKFGQ